nr:hypothetical protein [Tanacetum cinerariifolium]
MKSRSCYDFKGRGMMQDHLGMEKKQQVHNLGYSSKVCAASYVRYRTKKKLVFKCPSSEIAKARTGVEVIKNGNKVLTKTVGTTEQTYKPTTAEENLDKKNEVKAIGTLLMALLNTDQLKFHSYQDAKLLTEAIDKSTSSTNEADTTACGFSTAHTQGSSSSFDSEVDSCSKSCMKAYANLKEEYDSLTSDYKKSQHSLLSYKAGLQFVEERLVHYKKNEVVFTEKINVLNLKLKLGDNVLAEYTKNLEKAEKERYELKLTLEKLQNSSKSLNNLLDSQVSDKSKAGIGYKEITPDSFVNSSEILEKQENRSDKGYHEVPPPFTGNYMPYKLDIRLIDEYFKSVFVDVITNITPSDVKTVDVNGFVPQAVLTRSGKITTAGASVTTADRPVNTAGLKSTVNHPRLISKYFKRGHSQDTMPFNKLSANKHSVFNKKVSIVRVNDSTAKDRVVVSGNIVGEVNVVKASACWVWKAKHSSASNIFKKYSYIDARGRSKSIMAWIPKRA